MAFKADSGSWKQSEWRLPTGDGRFCNSSADAERKYDIHETEQRFAYVQPLVSKDDLHADAMRSILAHGDVGAVHRGAPQPKVEPATIRFNPIFRFSSTNSTWTAPPSEPLPIAEPDRSLAPRSHMHNRQLGNGTPRVGTNNITGSINHGGGLFVL